MECVEYYFAPSHVFLRVFAQLPRRYASYAPQNRARLSDNILIVSDLQVHVDEAFQLDLVTRAKCIDLQVEGNPFHSKSEEEDIIRVVAPT